MTHPLWGGMRDRKFGRVINISSINGQKGQMGQVELLRGQGRRHRLHQGAGPGRRQGRHHRQRDLPGLYRHRNGPCRAGKGAERRSSRRSRSAGSASPRRSRAAWCSWPPTTPASSPARRLPPMAVSIWPDRRHRHGLASPRNETAPSGRRFALPELRPSSPSRTAPCGRSPPARRRRSGLPRTARVAAAQCRRRTVRVRSSARG